MEKEEILAMKAEEELDKLVATEVMGEPIPGSAPDDALRLQLAGSPVESSQGNWLCLHTYSEGDIPTWRPMPFSTGISAAWLVWLKLTADEPCHWAIFDKGSEVSVEHYPDDYTGEIEEGCGDFSVDGPFPEAICKLALLAKHSQ